MQIILSIPRSNINLPVTEAFIDGGSPCPSQRTWKRIDTYRFPKSIPRGLLQGGLEKNDGFGPFNMCSILLNLL